MNLASGLQDQRLHSSCRTGEQTSSRLNLELVTPTDRLSTSLAENPTRTRCLNSITAENVEYRQIFQPMMGDRSCSTSSLRLMCSSVTSARELCGERALTQRRFCKSFQAWSTDISLVTATRVPMQNERPMTLLRIGLEPVSRIRCQSQGQVSLFNVAAWATTRQVSLSLGQLVQHLCTASALVKVSS